MKNRGFTLVEMAVALAVLSILLVALNQILVSTSSITLLSLKHIESDTESRLVLDRMSHDISKMVQRSDVDFDFPTTSNSNDQFYFFSESSGYFTSSGANPPVPSTVSVSSSLDPRGETSLVGYRINPTTYRLERLSKGLTWNGVTGSDSPMVYLPQTINSTWPNLANDTNFQSIGDGIFKLSISFLVQNSTTSAAISTIPNLEGKTIGQTGYFNPKDVIAIVISLGILDPNSQKLVPAGGLAQAAANLPEPTGATLPLTTWNSKISSLGLPVEAAAQVHFYQRFCYLNHAGAN